MQSFERAKKIAFKARPIMGVAWFPVQPHLLKVGALLRKYPVAVFRMRNEQVLDHTMFRGGHLRLKNLYGTTHDVLHYRSASFVNDQSV